MKDLNKKEVEDVTQILNRLLPLIDQAESKFRSARNWGFFDVLGGGFITDLIKHSKLNSAADIMNQINYLLGDLQRELQDIVIPADFTMRVGTFATFADFVFDGILADVYMQSKIMQSMKQIQELRRRLLILKNELAKLDLG